jgi:hypothetical protein
MKDSVKAGLLRLFEGDRDSVLSLFPYDTNDPDILWLKANSVEKTSDKLSLLTALINQPASEYTNLAVRIIERENKYEEMLSEPPSYKFWFKKTSPEEKQVEIDE